MSWRVLQYSWASRSGRGVAPVARRRPRATRHEAATRGRGAAEPQDELRGPRLRAPRPSRHGERLLEVHHERREAVVVHPAQRVESPRKARHAERMEFLSLRDRERPDRRGGDDPEGPLRPDEQPLQVEPGRRAADGPRSEDGAVREDRLEPEDLVPHRAPEVRGVPHAIRPDRAPEGRPRAGPRVVAQEEPVAAQATVEVLQDDPRLRGRRARTAVDRPHPAHPPQVEHDRVRRWPGPTHEPRAAAPRDDGTVEPPRDPEDRGDLRGRDREDDRGGGVSDVGERGPAGRTQGVHPVSRRDPVPGQHPRRADRPRQRPPHGRLVHSRVPRIVARLYLPRGPSRPPRGIGSSVSPQKPL